MKKTIVVLAMLLIALPMAFAWVGEERTLPAATADGKYINSIFANQVMGVEWVPCGKVSCKTYIKIDWLTVGTGGPVKPSTSYTLAVNTNEANKKQAICIEKATSSSTSVMMNGTWVKKGYLTIRAKYPWTSLLDDGKNERFYIVETSKINCATKKITTFNANEILETATI